MSANRARRRVLHAATALDAVERWADGCMLLREIGLVENGRIDGALVPLSIDSPGVKNNPMRKTGRPFWDRMGLLGVEVKLHRSDFLRGLKEKQFERYAPSFIGLYICTTLDVCKPSEIPREYGHLVVTWSDETERDSYKRIPVCVCKRHPQFKAVELDHETMWRVLWRSGEEMRKRAAEAEAKYARATARVGSLASEYIFGAVKALEKRAERELEGE